MCVLKSGILCTFASTLLGPVNTMRISIDGGHFFTGQGALSAVYLPYISESATRSWGKMAPSLRVGPPMRPCGVAHRSFGITKLRSARLAWSHWRANAGYPHSVNRPQEIPGSHPEYPRWYGPPGHHPDPPGHPPFSTVSPPRHDQVPQSSRPER